MFDDYRYLKCASMNKLFDIRADISPSSLFETFPRNQAYIFATATMALSNEMGETFFEAFKWMCKPSEIRRQRELEKPVSFSKCSKHFFNRPCTRKFALILFIFKSQITFWNNEILRISQLIWVYCEISRLHLWILNILWVSFKQS